LDATDAIRLPRAIKEYELLFSELKTKAAHLLRGASAEQQACDFLLKQGLILVTRNFRCKQGELDLIMRDQRTLVIVEVRFRKTDQYGSALESVTRAKQSRIMAATEVYLSKHKLNTAVRFDVLALSGNGKLEWIKNAF
jgi:putative endonuclease